jgi:hypothetical protein
MLSWKCVVASDHPLAAMAGPLSDDTLRNWPSLVLEDTSRSLPKRITWLLDNQRGWWRLTGNPRRPAFLPGCAWRWCRPFCPSVDRCGEWVALALENPFPDAACCLTWQQMTYRRRWLAAGLSGGQRNAEQEWLREPENWPGTRLTAVVAERTVRNGTAFDKTRVNFNRLRLFTLVDDPSISMLKAVSPSESFGW